MEVKSWTHAATFVVITAAQEESKLTAVRVKDWEQEQQSLYTGTDKYNKIETKQTEDV
jgi:hypothetical protein